MDDGARQGATGHDGIDPADPSYMTSRDVAQLLRVSVETVRRAARAGRLQCVKIGSLRRYTLEQVEAWTCGGSA